MEQMNSNEFEVAETMFSNHLPGGMLVYKEGGDEEILFASDGLIKMFGCDSWDEFLTHTHGSFKGIVHPDELDEVEADIVRQINSSGDNRIDYVEYRIITKTGAVKWVKDFGHLVSIPKYGRAFYVMIGEDGTDQSTTARMHMEASWTVTRDPMTGLYDRSYGEKIINAKLTIPDFKDGVFVVIDIDNFKRVNDRLGHQKGDETLIFIAAEIRRQMGENCVCCRAGGDEFIIFLPNINQEERDRRLEDLRSAIRMNLKGDNHFVSISASMGAVETPRYGRSFSDLYEKADHALSRAKDQGKDRLVFYEGEDLLEDDNPDELLEAFSNAIEHRYIKVYYQPVMRTISNEICGMEALARWQDPVRGFLTPNRFIPILEQSHRITELDLYVVREICQMLYDSIENNEAIVPISFNLSRFDFVSCDMFAEVEKAVKEYDIPRDMLNVEITESMIMENPNLIQQEMSKFRAAGYQVWMDDFGSGYSSLNVLNNYSFDEIKLDMVFMRNLDEKTKEIISSVVVMAKHLGIHTLAEGVETVEQYEFLKQIGCEKVQGYYIDRPRPIEECTKNIYKHKRGMEGRGWRKYYNAMLNVDMLTDLPIAVFDYYEDNITCLLTNHGYQEFWKKIGVENTADLFGKIKIMSTSSRKVFFDLVGVMNPDDHQSTDYLAYGHNIRSELRCISSYRGHSLILENVVNLSSEQDAEQNEEELISQAIRSAMDRLVTLNLNTNQCHTLVKGTEGSVLISDSVIDESSVDQFLTLEIRSILKDDRDEFKKWTDLHSLDEEEIVTRYFRTKTPNGAYLWKAHSMFFDKASNTVFYWETLAHFEDTDLPAKLGQRGMNSMQHLPESTLWQSMMQSRTTNFFWKDKNRRFLGANQTFLDTYGFTSEDEIIGKTDEDMHWHIDDVPFENDEWDVLTKGTYVVNRPGKCIIHGRTYDILATKEPLYKDGEIVGLFGYIIPLKSEMGIAAGRGNMLMEDPKTGLLTASSLTAVLADYVENWERRDEDFSIIDIDVEQYSRLVKTYGDTVGDELLRTVASIIQNAASVTANVSRQYSGRFIVLMRQKDDAVIEEFMVRMHDEISAIHEIEGFRVTLQPKIHRTRASEVKNSRELFLMTLIGPEAES